MIGRSVWLVLLIAFITLVPSTVSYAAAELDDEQPTMLRSMSNKSVVPAGAWPVWPTPPATEIAGGPGANAFDPLVTVGDDGRTTLVWKQRGSNDSVHVATRAAGSASFGPTEQIHISATGKYIASLDMATGADGTTTIAWTRQDGQSSKYVVHATTRSPGSSSFGPVEDLSDSSTNSWTPQVVVDAAGQSTVAWRTSASGGELVTATRAPGASNFATSSVYATNTGYPAIHLVADDSGATTLLWTVDTGSMYWTGLAVADRPPGAVNFGSATTVVTNYANLPSFATSPAGDLTLAYEETDPVSPYSETLKVRTRPAGSSTFGAPEQIPGAIPVGTVEVAVGRDGTTAVLWFEYDLSYNYVSYAAVRGAGEGTWTTESLSNPDPVKQGQIAVGPDGAVTAVWSHQGTPDVIEVQTRQPGNSSFDSSVDVSATNAGNDPQIAIGPDGAATVTWYTDPGRVEYVTSSATSYDLSVTSTGPGSGSIDSTPGGISCGATCTFGFDLSSTVVLSATPAAGSTFSGWSGSGCAGTGNCSVAVNGLQSVSAQFDTVPAVAPIPVIFPPGVPIGTSAEAGENAVTVTWSEPASSGSFPMTYFQVRSQPGGRLCLVTSAVTSCEVTDLANNTDYTFMVRALNGAGWGPWSAATLPVTPLLPEDPAEAKDPTDAFMISGSRRGRLVQVRGVTTLTPGALVTAHIRFPGAYPYRPVADALVVSAESSFTWQRKTRKKVYVYFRSEDGLTSTRLIIPAR